MPRARRQPLWVVAPVVALLWAALAPSLGYGAAPAPPPVVAIPAHAFTGAVHVRTVRLPAAAGGVAIRVRRRCGPGATLKVTRRPPRRPHPADPRARVAGAARRGDDPGRPAPRGAHGRRRPVGALPAPARVRRVAPARRGRRAPATPPGRPGPAASTARRPRRATAAPAAARRRPRRPPRPGGRHARRGAHARGPPEARLGAARAERAHDDRRPAGRPAYTPGHDQGLHPEARREHARRRARHQRRAQRGRDRRPDRAAGELVRARSRWASATASGPCTSRASGSTTRRARSSTPSRSSAPKATVQLENLRATGLRGSYDTNHTDIVQPWGGVARLRVDRLSGTTNYQGIFNQPDQGPIGPVDLRHVDLSYDNVGARTGGYLLWLTNGCSAATTTLTDVYVKGRTRLDARVDGVAAARRGDDCPASIVQNVASWPALPITGVARWGAPPGGPFVDRGRRRHRRTLAGLRLSRKVSRANDRPCVQRRLAASARRGRRADAMGDADPPRVPPQPGRRAPARPTPPPPRRTTHAPPAPAPARPSRRPGRRQPARPRRRLRAGRRRRRLDHARRELHRRRPRRPLASPRRRRGRQDAGPVLRHARDRLGHAQRRDHVDLRARARRPSATARRRSASNVDGVRVATWAVTATKYTTYRSPRRWPPAPTPSAPADQRLQHASCDRNAYVDTVRTSSGTTTTAAAAPAATSPRSRSTRSSAGRRRR